MLFNSEAYLFFLPAVVVLTWCLPSRLRPAFLLLASWYFYAFWSPPFLFLIIGLTIANYLVGLVQGRQAERRRSLLVLALLIDVGALGIFKYLGLLDQSAARRRERSITANQRRDVLCTRAQLLVERCFEVRGDVRVYEPACARKHDGHCKREDKRQAEPDRQPSQHQSLWRSR